MIRNNLIAATIAAGAMVAGITLAAPVSADADGTVDCSPCAKAPGKTESSGSSSSSSSSSTAAEDTEEGGGDDGGTIKSPGGIVEKWRDFPDEQAKKWTEFPEKQAKKWTDFPEDQAAKWGLAPSDDEGEEDE